MLHEVSRKTGIPIIPFQIPIILGTIILANARVFISGRHHPSILASLGGTPCVFLASNSHKTLSMQEVLEYDLVREFSALPSDQDCDQIVATAASRLKAGDALRQTIQQVVQRRSEEARGLLDLIRP